MRKFVFVLPACALFLAGAVLTSELGPSLSAQTPDAVAEADDATYVVDESDITAATWVETGLKAVDTRKPRIPVPAVKAKNKKKRK